jgi:hypothetical protein
MNELFKHVTAKIKETTGKAEQPRKSHKACHTAFQIEQRSSSACQAVKEA